jgi:hypothetical protein
MVAQKQLDRLKDANTFLLTLMEQTGYINVTAQENCHYTNGISKYTASDIYRP